MPEKGHTKRPGDDQLMQEFLEAIAPLSVHGAQLATGISHGTISRFRRAEEQKDGTWKGITGETRRKMMAYVERKRARITGAGEEKLLVARYLERMAEALRDQAREEEEGKPARAPEIPIEWFTPAGGEPGRVRRGKA